MRCSALIRSYGVTDYLSACIYQYVWCEKIVVMNYRFPTAKVREDKTPEICSRFSNVTCISGEGQQEESINTGLSALSEFDLVFIADNDEFITKEVQLKLIDFMDRDRSVDSGQIWLLDYAKDFDHIFEQRPHTPVVIARPNRTRFWNARNVDGRSVRAPQELLMHHLGYLYAQVDKDWKYDWERPIDLPALDIEGKRILQGNLPQEIRDLVAKHE